MIITAKKALDIVSTHAVIQQVPELLNAVEAFAAKKREWKPKQKCGNCDEVSFFQPIEGTALTAIESLPSDAIARLKKFLNAKDLYINTAATNGQSNLKPLQ